MRDVLDLISASAEPPAIRSSAPATLVELLRWRALNQPDELAYTFLACGEAGEIRLTYGELDRQARGVAARLRGPARRGDRALLLYPPGPEFIVAFFGCLFAGVVAVPAYPPRLNRNLLRIRAIAADAGARVVLCVSSVLMRMEALFGAAPELKQLRWLATDGATRDAGEAWEEVADERDELSPQGDEPCFLQYTSGSTGQPKGVMVSQRNLLTNLSLIWQHRLARLDGNHMVTWLPVYHDMGLIGGVLLPLYGGFSCTLMSPTAFLQRPISWLEAISRCRATISIAPNFAYDLCVRKIKPERREALDLDSWRIAYNGAEPVRRETLARFTTAFAPCGFRAATFYPCYGLAEATLMVSVSESALPLALGVRAAALARNRIVEAQPEDQEATTLISCGTTPASHRIVIVHPESLVECRRNEVGEIWVAGASVAAGYWRKPEETARTFAAYLAETGEGPFLRTGDLGFIKEGNLFVAGRLKDVIILDGRNHYPQDIEATVEQSHPALRPGGAAAFAIEVDGYERLAIVAEVERRGGRARGGELSAAERPAPLADEIVKTIRRAVSENHEIRVHDLTLLKPGGVPKTSSGKTQRHACRANFLNGAFAAWDG